ncbi:MAG TPA: hypothetical protein V6C95_18715 [Coleofasciculaceae cyanobacterium]
MGAVKTLGQYDSIIVTLLYIVRLRLVIERITIRHSTNVKAVLPVFMVNRIAKANISIWRIQAGAIRRLTLAIAPLVIILLGCQDANNVSQDNWKVYRNPRYDFEFPYPSNWVAFPMPDNRDGQAFRDPNNPNSEIRGWAANNLSAMVIPPASRVLHHGQNALKVEASLLDSTEPTPLKSQEENFTTDQGLTGNLKVEIGSDTSVMTLTLSQGKILYNWQGQCESEDFAAYYRSFYYIARQYRLPPLK